jgi:amidohydrolase
MNRNDKIVALADELETYVISARRKIHEYAEIGGEEIKTHQFICNELEKMNLSYETIADTGVLAILDTNKPGPKIALRADIDALPMAENEYNLKHKKVCVSKNPNTCHACGHDAHTAMLLASVQILVKMKEALTGSFYFCFEEGEETGKGNQQMLEALEKIKPDTVWAIHVRSELESGKLSIESGPRMAGAAVLQINVNGRGGHGSRPDQCLNPTFAAACIVANIPGAFVNQLEAGDIVTYGVTTIQAGGTGNIIPDSASIQGSLRFFSTKAGEQAVNIIKKVAAHTATMHGCTVDTDKTNVVIGPVINNQECSEIAYRAIQETMPESITKCEKWYASESFSLYLKNYPGVMAFLGVGNEEKGTTAVHHNEYFDIDESALITGVKATVLYATQFMEENKRISL